MPHHGVLASFRAWFILQHYDRFAFKPFTTLVFIQRRIELRTFFAAMMINYAILALAMNS
ncbi:DUF3289 family protein [Aeromonas salmonicida]|uniref:DUF3289 family protein n=1 Tax=Aeromonas salmonicida TaxID=645 RepID=UPI0038BBACC2